MDFGFNDPDAMTKVAIDRKRQIIYLKECIYSAGNSADALRDKMKPHIKGNELIVGDCADARMINDLRRSPTKKNFNIVPVNKGKWTVADALKMMQGYEIVVDAGKDGTESRNLAKELTNYVWDDKKAGVPIGEWNHLCDSFRYVFMYFMDKSRKGITQQN
jgi:phage terminase large subunit